jgi:hypothetical protein
MVLNMVYYFTIYCEGSDVFHKSNRIRTYRKFTGNSFAFRTCICISKHALYNLIGIRTYGLPFR